jgi:hypothetical protein
MPTGLTFSILGRGIGLPPESIPSSTPNGHDLEAVIAVAFRDAGIAADDATIHRDGEQTRIQLSANVNQSARDQFETELTSRIRELVNPSASESFS